MPAGNVSWDVTVTDSAGATSVGVLTLTIAPAALSITTTSLPPAQVGVAYSATLTATGGVGPYTWAVSGGSLPAGLSLSAAGVISGTPV